MALLEWLLWILGLGTDPIGECETDDRAHIDPGG